AVPVLVLILVFSFKRLKFLLHFFQQEEYDNRRFFKFIFKNNQLVDKRLSIVTLVTTVSGISHLHQILVMTAALCLAIYFEKNPTHAKKPLVMTKRATRIFITAFALTLFQILNNNYKLSAPVFTLIITIQMLPFVLIAANLLLYPYE